MPTKKQQKKIGGPFLASALFCESVLEDKDGVLSAMRIIDAVNVTVSGDAPADFPSANHPVPIAQWLLITIKSGDASGKHSLELVIHEPTGEKKSAAKREVDLSTEPNGGVSVKTRILLEAKAAGIYLVDVLLDGKRLTRAPLNVAVHREKKLKPVKKAKKSSPRKN